MKMLLLAIWHYRHFILTSIRNDLRTRFARSRLGAIWAILQPLFQGLIYAVVFTDVLGAKLPNATNKYAYVIYLLAGMAGWNLFNEVVTRCLTIFVDNASLLKKMVFPRICLPIIVSGASLLNSLFLLVAVIAIFLMAGAYPDWTWLWIPVLMVISALFGLALGLILGILNVFVRDVAQVMNVVLQLWFWLTPIVYAVQTAPTRFGVILRFNPMYSVCLGYQRVFLWHEIPPVKTLGILVVGSIVVLGIGMFLFRRAAPDMVDVL